MLNFNLLFFFFFLSTFCIIEGPETVQDFVQMQLQEIQDNIRSRRNKIFLLMEEVKTQKGVLNVHFLMAYSLFDTFGLCS